jgi:hypothetical protein
MFTQPVGAFLSFGLILATITMIANNRKLKMAKEVSK